MTALLLDMYLLVASTSRVERSGAMIEAEGRRRVPHAAMARAMDSGVSRRNVFCGTIRKVKYLRKCWAGLELTGLRVWAYGCAPRTCLRFQEREA